MLLTEGHGPGALRLGVYGKRALSVAWALTEYAMGRFGCMAASCGVGLYADRLTLTADGEVAVRLSGPGAGQAGDCRKARRRIGRLLLKAARERLLDVAPEARGAGSASWTPARLRSSGLAGKALGLGACGGATLAECLCLAEAVVGDKGRKALVRAYGEEAVRKAVGSPADPVTAAAVGAVMRDIQALMGERERRLAEIDRLETLEMRELREKWHAERKRATGECDAAVAALNARIAELRREAGDGEGEA